MKNHSEELAKKLVESEIYQKESASKVILEDFPRFDGEFVTGVDVSYRGEKSYACAAVIHLPTRTIKRTERLVLDCDFPYIPGHFYLREGPALIQLLETIEDTGPVLIDGNGILHPRRFGLASYIGVEMNIQTIGVAKSLHLGTMMERIANTALVVDSGEILGSALWIGQKRKPLFVSVGHRISLTTAIEVTLMASFNDYPEPLRKAHSCSIGIQRDVAET
ncbi:MAG: endonuclease V [Candidatus Thorarchaeota archaeon]